MFLDGDGENADSGGVPPLGAPVEGASTSLHGARAEGAMEEGASFEASLQNSLSFEPNGDSGENTGGLHSGDLPLDKPPTPPPKSPKSPTTPLHLRSTSRSSSIYAGTARSSMESGVPSLCPSSFRPCSLRFTESSVHLSPAHAHSLLAPIPTLSHIHVHVIIDNPGPPGYYELFAHHRHPGSHQQPPDQVGI